MADSNRKEMQIITSLSVILHYVHYYHPTALREEVLYVIYLDLHKAYDALDRSR